MHFSDVSMEFQWNFTKVFHCVDSLGLFTGRPSSRLRDVRRNRILFLGTFLNSSNKGSNCSKVNCKANGNFHYGFLITRNFEKLPKLILMKTNLTFTIHSRVSTTTSSCILPPVCDTACDSKASQKN